MSRILSEFAKGAIEMAHPTDGIGRQELDSTTTANRRMGGAGGWGEIERMQRKAALLALAHKWVRV